MASLTTSSDLSGGIRYSLSDTQVVDVGVTLDSSSSSEVGYFVDYYDGYYGILVAAAAGESPTYSAMFAVEGYLSADVSIGIGFKIVELSHVESAQFVSGWDVYLLIPF